jgi:hypothetical protein
VIIQSLSGSSFGMRGEVVAPMTGRLARTILFDFLMNRYGQEDETTVRSRNRRSHSSLPPMIPVPNIAAATAPAVKKPIERPIVRYHRPN